MKKHSCLSEHVLYREKKGRLAGGWGAVFVSLLSLLVDPIN